VSKHKIEVTEPAEPEQNQEQPPEPATGEEPAEQQTEPAETDAEMVVTIDDGTQPPDDDKNDVSTLRHLRSVLKEQKKEAGELRRRLQQYEQQQQQQSTTDPGPKPSLEACDYDTEKYEQKLNAWMELKNKVRIEQERAQAAEREQAEAWTKKLTEFENRKSALKVRDFEDAEQVALSALNQLQYSIIIDATDQPELVLYALGKNPEKLKQLASIANAARFSVEIGKLESKLKLSPKKSLPPPEKQITSVGATGGQADQKLARLRAEAEKTGDYTEVNRHRAEMRRKRAG
jgi:hypothetical protein